MKQFFFLQSTYFIILSLVGLYAMNLPFWIALAHTVVQMLFLWWIEARILPSIVTRIVGKIFHKKTN